jgi:hypothetical protein
MIHKGADHTLALDSGIVNMRCQGLYELRTPHFQCSRYQVSLKHITAAVLLGPKWMVRGGRLPTFLFRTFCTTIVLLS